MPTLDARETALENPIPELAATLRVFQPAPNVLAFYDGRVAGARAYSGEPNWLDDGAYELGICTYAILSGAEALVYDTHISLAHARRIRAMLTARGVDRIKVVLSHWHRDHIAGNEVFADCEIIAHSLTAQALDEQRVSIETGSPPIKPLVGPMRTYEEMLQLQVGNISVELRHVDIHSRDGTLLLLPEIDLLFAGDALEDPITYVAEPDRLAIHLVDLQRIAAWPIRRILPNHGDPNVIAAGGYEPGLIAATIHYVQTLIRSRSEPELAKAPLSDWIEDDLALRRISVFPPYEKVHKHNVARMQALGAAEG
ncbi:MBL fold metallo-hydrolase [Microvirga sp. Mcv34]|uniref:MBL fold metallo-hydrolase n=1 Tax=Microvirga sp. Mcv34 TaxID=2926016 RepID=UPI0021C994BE|nr:MBL fold metallo-hydrolase [Microvirga sp. Mcv34]